MEITIAENAAAIGEAAAARGAAGLRDAIARNGAATVVLATGVSQFPVLAALVREDVDWSRVTAFHLDEYIGMGPDHPASFRRFLRERFVAHVPSLRAFHFIAGDAPDPAAELARINALIAEQEVDVMFAGIGENAHLDFNDPPADFEVDAGFHRVRLDERCRRQQLGEGWFATLADVPDEAISMTIRQIMRAQTIVLSVPDRRKAEAVRDTLEGPVTPMVPASILRGHERCYLYLDPDSAALLQRPNRQSSTEGTPR